jgi:hypothetical protein
MKRNFAFALIGLSTLAACGKAVAQEPAVKATVPFEFTVGGRLLPADTYTITASSGVLFVKSVGGRYSAITTASYDNRSVEGGKLVFNKYGDQYFLHEVLCPTVGMHSNIPASKLEKRVKTQEARLGGGEPVLVAAK